METQILRVLSLPSLPPVVNRDIMGRGTPLSQFKDDRVANEARRQRRNSLDKTLKVEQDIIAAKVKNEEKKSKKRPRTDDGAQDKVMDCYSDDEDLIGKEPAPQDYSATAQHFARKLLEASVGEQPNVLQKFSRKLQSRSVATICVACSTRSLTRVFGMLQSSFDPT